MHEMNEELKPVRGIANGVIAGAIIWTVIIGVVVWLIA